MIYIRNLDWNLSNYSTLPSRARVKFLSAISSSPCWLMAISGGEALGPGGLRVRSPFMHRTSMSIMWANTVCNCREAYGSTARRTRAIAAEAYRPGGPCSRSTRRIYHACFFNKGLPANAGW
jgi:hypothetical protein